MDRVSPPIDSKGLIDSQSSSNRISSSNGSNVRKNKEKSRIILAYYVFSLSSSNNNGHNNNGNVFTSESSRSTAPKGTKSQLSVMKRYFSTASKSAAIGTDGIDYSGQRRQSSTDSELDEESIALLCLPDGSCTINELLSSPHEQASKFHTFLITRQNGQRYYGSSLIVKTKCRNSLNVHCIITDIPFVTATRQLLYYFAHVNPDASVIQRICNLRVPSKGKCLKLLLPPWSHTSVNGNNVNCLASPYRTDSRSRFSAAVSTLPANSFNDRIQDFLDEKGIYVYRGTADFPLLDYPLRQLFCDVLSPNVFIQLLTAALLEYQILLISNDYYKLMLISETLTSLLAPFSWQHVYVPILPVALGLHYLDAPTPYIMGLNSDLYVLQMNQQEMSLASNRQTQQQYPHDSPSFAPMSLASLSVTHTSQVRVFCDENRLEFIPAACDQENRSDRLTDLLEPPPFLHQLKSEIDMILNSNVKLATMDCKLRPKSSLMAAVVNAAKAHDLMKTEKFCYLDDLKLNHLIRITCSTLLQHNLLREYQKFIVTSDGDRFNSSSTHMNGFKFDSGPFLSDQPDSLVPFMSKFLQTQMFASFIDDKCKKLKKSRAANSSATFYSHDPLVMSIRRSSHVTQQNLKCIASSIDDVYDGAFEDATIVNLNEIDLSKSCSSPRRQRKVYDKPLENFDLKCNIFKSPAIDPVETVNVKAPTSLDVFSTNNPSQLKRVPADASPNEPSSALISETNWRIVESLLRETKSKTKRILLEKMSSDEVTPLALPLQDHMEGNTLITSLCDLIERVWNHENKTHGSHSSFWSYVTVYCDTQLQSPPDLSEMSTSLFQPDRLSVTKNGTNDLVGTNRRGQPFLSHSTPASPMHRMPVNNGSSRSSYAATSRLFNQHLQNGTFKFESTHCNQLLPLPTSLHYDVSSVASMVDVKTDHGKTRAFLRLALERKLLSSHLRTLCSNAHLLTSKYKRPAFLRAEEEREQFLTHLLTLNAVDLLCFTNTFTTSSLSYKFSLFSSGPVSGSFVLSGTLNDSLSIAIESNEMSFVFKCKNLGLIKFLTLTTFTSKVYVDYILIRNEITGHLFRFNCNKWFGRNVDDDSMERVLLAEHIIDPNTVSKLIEKTGQKTSSIGRQFKRGLSSTLDSLGGNRNELLTAEQLRQQLATKIDQLLSALQSHLANETSRAGKNKYRPSNYNSTHPDVEDDEDEESLQLVMDPFGQGTLVEGKTAKFNPLHVTSSSSSINTIGSTKSVGSTIAMSLGYQQFNQLYFAENFGLFNIIMQTLYFGLKNRTKSPFRKQVYLWDYLVRLQMELKLSWRTLDANGTSVPRNSDPSSLSPSGTGTMRGADKRFIEIIESIHSQVPYRGKDGKALMFVAIACRHKLLAPHFIRLLTWPSLATQFYQMNSFLTNPVLTVSLVKLLVQLNQVTIETDSAITKGL